MDTVPVFAAISATVFNYVRANVPLPFIDEFFHLRQAQVYCKHQFSVWDPKITTPPGLYILATLYHHILHAFGVKRSCNYTVLRSLNAVGGCLVLPWLLSLLPTRNFWKINIVSTPLLFTYYFLFYTDVWSTVLVTAVYVFALRYKNAKGAILANLAGFMSLWFRQTNIVWVAFAAVVFVDARRPKSASLWQSCRLFIKQALKDWLLLLPFAANAALFAAFLKYNGGITFGDKENHQVTIHLVQVFYCTTFMAFFTLPLWLGRKTVQDYLRFAVSGNKFVNVLFTALSYYAIHYIVCNFTVVHPFLLADNRHYTFYIFKRILSKPYAKYAVVPVYHFTTWLVPYLLARTDNSILKMSPLAIAGFAGATVATLVPSPLFEPRYYIVPLLLLRLFSSHASGGFWTLRQKHRLEFLWNSFINTVFFVVFFSYEFTWATEPGVQRIIW